MEKTKFVFLVIVLALLLVSCTPAPTEEALQTSNAVQVPLALFDGVMILLLTAATIWVFEKTGLDLRQYAIPIAMTIATFLVGLLQGWIDLQPVELDPWIALGIRVLEAIFLAIGGLRLVSRQSKTLMP